METHHHIFKKIKKLYNGRNPRNGEIYRPTNCMHALFMASFCTLILILQDNRIKCKEKRQKME